MFVSSQNLLSYDIFHLNLETCNTHTKDTYTCKIGQCIIQYLPYIGTLN